MSDREILRKLASIDKSLKAMAKSMDRGVRDGFIRETPPPVYPQIYYGEPSDPTHIEEDCE